MKKRFTTSQLLFLMFILLPSFAFSAEPVLDKQVLVASVSFRDVVPTSQDGNTVNIAFSLVNGDGIQAGVKYGVQLVSRQNDMATIVDEKVFEEKLLLAQNSTTQRTISYTAPATLSGEYEIVLMSKNEAGFPFAFYKVGSFSFSALAQGIFVDTATCKVQLNDEKEVYSLRDLIPVPDTTSKLIASCDVVNNTEAAIVANVQVVTKKSSVFGDVLKTPKNSTEEVMFAPKEKKIVPIMIPLASSAGPYIAEITFVVDGVSSNIVPVRYVINVANYVSILNISLDNDVYKKGDTAKLSVVWSAPPTGLALTATLKNGIGMNCAKEVNQEMLLGVAEVLFSVTSSCSNPQVSVVLKNTMGEILAQKKFSVTPESNKDTAKIVGIVILALIGAVAVRRIIKERKNKNISTPTISTPLAVFLPFILFMGGIVLIPFQKAEASATYVSGGMANIVTVVDVLSPTYAPETDIFISWYVENQSLSVSSPVSLQVVNDIGQGINNPSFPLLSQTTFGPGQKSGGGVPTINSSIFDTPSSSGTYKIEFETGVLEPVYIRASLINVNEWTTNGTACGNPVTLHHLTSSELVEFFSDPLGTVPLDVTGMNFRLSVRGQLTPVLSGTSYQFTGMEIHETVEESGFQITSPAIVPPGMQGFMVTSWTCVTIYDFLPGLKSLWENLAGIAQVLHYLMIDSSSEYEFVYTPPIVNFSYVTETYPYSAQAKIGDPVTLIWWSGISPATCTGSGFSTGGSASGIATTSPIHPGNKTFSISCSNVAGSDTQSITLPLVASIDFYATPDVITQGQGSQTTTLYWNAPYATSCTGTEFSTGTAPSGSVTISPFITGIETYHLSCAYSETVPGSSVETSVQVNYQVVCPDEYGGDYYCPYGSQCIGSPTWGCQ